MFDYWRVPLLFWTSFGHQEPRVLLLGIRTQPPEHRTRQPSHVQGLCGRHDGEKNATDVAKKTPEIFHGPWWHSKWHIKWFPKFGMSISRLLKMWQKLQQLRSACFMLLSFSYRRSHMLYVWYIYLRLGGFEGKCIYMNIILYTWSIWVCESCWSSLACRPGKPLYPCVSFCTNHLGGAPSWTRAQVNQHQRNYRIIIFFK